MQITGLSRTNGRLAPTLRAANARERAVRALGSRLGLDQPVFTAETARPLTVTTSGGDVPLNLLARTDVLDHVQILRRTSGPGVWVSDATARIAHLAPGGTLRLRFSEHGVGDKSIALRVKGVYRALDATDARARTGCTSSARSSRPASTRRRRCATSCADRDELYRIVQKLSTRPDGQGSRAGVSLRRRPARHDDGGAGGRPARPDDRTRPLADAELLAAAAASSGASALGRTLACTGPSPITFIQPGDSNPPRCRVASSLASAVAIADRNVSEISPVVTLLSGAATAIALAFAGAAGVFLVRRRAAESALLYARGERTSTFALRTALELARCRSPSGRRSGSGWRSRRPGCSRRPARSTPARLTPRFETARSQHWPRSLLAALAATLAFLRQFDSGTRPHRWLARIPWELPVLAVAGWLLYDLLSGGGLAGQATGAGHPTLAVFVFPLLLVAGVAGLVVRVLRPLLRLGGNRAAALPTAVFLAVRRLAAAGGSAHGAPGRHRRRIRLVLLLGGGRLVPVDRRVREGVRRLRRRRTGPDLRFGGPTAELPVSADEARLREPGCRRRWARRHLRRRVRGRRLDARLGDSLVSELGRRSEVAPAGSRARDRRAAAGGGVRRRSRGNASDLASGSASSGASRGAGARFPGHERRRPDGRRRPHRASCDRAEVEPVRPAERPTDVRLGEGPSGFGRPGARGAAARGVVRQQRRRVPEAARRAGGNTRVLVHAARWPSPPACSCSSGSCCTSDRGSARRRSRRRLPRAWGFGAERRSCRSRSSSGRSRSSQPWSAGSSPSRRRALSSATSTRCRPTRLGRRSTIPVAAILGSAVALVAIAIAAGAFTSWASRRTNMAEALRVV